jgi:hypothetical protein
VQYDDTSSSEVDVIIGVSARYTARTSSLLSLAHWRDSAENERL